MPKTDTVIIGAGLSGLTIAHLLKTRCYGHRFLLLEKEKRPGGAIRTHAENGFIAEAGPHGFLDNCPESRELLVQTGLESECLRAPLGRFARYIYLNKRLNRIPQTPAAILGTSLIGWQDKLRVLGDLFKKPLTGEPTVASWVAQRFGPALLPFIDAALTGTYGGDMDRLVIDGVMPGVRALERQYGSVIRGLVAARRKRSGPKRSTLPAMTSFPGGMQRLPERLCEFLQPKTELRLGCKAVGLHATKSGWKVDLERGSVTCTNLVLALPVNASLALLHDIDSNMPLPSIPEAKIATVALGFDNEVDLPPGFGYLIPEQEGRFTLGALFSSNMFPGRAAGGGTLIEVLVGGRRHPERAGFNDQLLIEYVMQEIKDTLNISSQPVHVKVLRSGCGIPQPEQDFGKLIAWRNELCLRHRGLYISGFGWNGIGINDMIKTADRVAGDIMAGTTDKARKADIKGVYF